MSEQEPSALYPKHLLTYLYRKKGNKNPDGALQVMDTDPHSGGQQASKRLYELGYDMDETEIQFAGYFA